MQEARGKRQVAIGVTVFCVSFFVYVLTLAPDITWAHDGGDGGDLIAAVVTGGVPHPPGYPTYLLLTWPLTWLPYGNPAWRLNLFSALGAAGAAALTALATARLVENNGHSSHIATAAGISAGLALAFSPVLWSQAVITEVYTLGALFTALMAFVAVHRLTERLPWGCLYGIAMGLTLGAQPSLILTGSLAPFALGRRGKNWAWAGSGFLAGLMVFLVLPIRARSGAPVNWGDTSTLSGLGWLISARLYQGFVLALPLDVWGSRLVAWAALIVRQFTPLGALLGMWGLWRLFKLQRGLTLAMLAMFAGWGIFAIGYNTTDSYVYLIPAFILLAMWMGVGLAEVLSLASLCGLSGTLRWGTVLALPLVELSMGWPAADIHADRVAVTFGQNTLQQAPQGAVLLTEQDKYTFTLWYFRYARGQRPDVTVVDRDLLAMPWYRATIGREAGLRDLSTASDPLEALRASGRRICQVSFASLACE
jgi:hypothetical protein